MAGNVAFSASNEDGHDATAFSTSSLERSWRRRNSNAFVEKSVPMPTLKPCETGFPPKERDSMSQ